MIEFALEGSTNYNLTNRSKGFFFTISLFSAHEYCTIWPEKSKKRGKISQARKQVNKQQKEKERIKKKIKKERIQESKKNQRMADKTLK